MCKLTPSVMFFVHNHAIHHTKILLLLNRTFTSCAFGLYFEVKIEHIVHEILRYLKKNGVIC